MLHLSITFDWLCTVVTRLRTVHVHQRLERHTVAGDSEGNLASRNITLASRPGKKELAGVE